MDDKVRAAINAWDEECNPPEELADYLARAGYVIVPKEPTSKILDAGCRAFRNGGLLPSYTDAGTPGQEPIIRYLLRTMAWPAMLAAARSRKGEVG